MTRRNHNPGRLCSAAALAFFLLVPPALAETAFARELFPGYPAAVRAQAERVVSVAGPGRETETATEVRQLRIRMHGLGILSMNAIPDLLFERAVREGWKKEVTPALRAVREVAPFSVPMWAWLVKEDFIGMSLTDFSQDVDGLIGSLERFGPALVGSAAWLISFLSAAGCWFVAWGSISLFLRARPSLEGDVMRFLPTRYRGYLAPVLAAVLFVLPLMAGFGLAVAACIWLFLSAGYVRRGELAVLSAGILILAGVLLGGGILHSLRMFGGEGAHEGWLGGEGSLAAVRARDASSEAGGPLSEATLSWMVRFEKAREQMQTGHAAQAEKSWTSLVEEGRQLPEVLNNRGIARAQQGKIDEALDDFEAADAIRRHEGPALWNAYLVHLKRFNLEQARKIQPESWERIQKMAPFMLSPFDMEQGEWIASPLPVGEIWRAIFHFRGEWIRDAGKSAAFGLFFHPLPAQGALPFLAASWLAAGLWQLLARRIWVHGTCRACGSGALLVRSREAADICTPCRVKIGGGIRAGEERNRRVQSIVMHRRYVKGASVLLPGAGALWAGKEIRALAFGAVLSVALGCLTVSLGGERAGDVLLAELQGTVALWSAVLAGLLWAGGAAWGVRSFSMLQRAHNIAGERM